MVGHEVVFGPAEGQVVADVVDRAVDRTLGAVDVVALVLHSLDGHHPGGALDGDPPDAEAEDRDEGEDEGHAGPPLTVQTRAWRERTHQVTSRKASTEKVPPVLAATVSSRDLSVSPAVHAA